MFPRTVNECSFSYIFIYLITFDLKLGPIHTNQTWANQQELEHWKVYSRRPTSSPEGGTSLSSIFVKGSRSYVVSTEEVCVHHFHQTRQWQLRNKSSKWLKILDDVNVVPEIRTVYICWGTFLSYCEKTKQPITAVSLTGTNIHSSSWQMSPDTEHTKPTRLHECQQEQLVRTYIYMYTQYMSREPDSYWQIHAETLQAAALDLLDAATSASLSSHGSVNQHSTDITAHLSDRFTGFDSQKNMVGLLKDLEGEEKKQLLNSKNTSFKQETCHLQAGVHG